MLGLGRIIPRIHAHSYFCVRASTNPHHLSRVIVCFNALFSIDAVHNSNEHQLKDDKPKKSTKDTEVDFVENVDRVLLYTILSAYTGSKPLVEVVTYFPSYLHAFGVDITIWLLRWQLIENMETIYQSRT